jgi:receptor protein-tyrosine kinase
MKNLINDLRERFDIVLIDAPPLLPVTDAAILASSSDGAILVARHGKTTRDQISVAVGRLGSVSANLMGTVANMTPARRGSYGYGYSYGYAPEAGRSKRESVSKAARWGRGEKAAGSGYALGTEATQDALSIARKERKERRARSKRERKEQKMLARLEAQQQKTQATPERQPEKPANPPATTVEPPPRAPAPSPDDPEVNVRRSRR